MKEVIDLPIEITLLVGRYNMHPVTAWRHHFNLSQAEFARRLGITLVEAKRVEESNQHLS